VTAVVVRQRNQITIPKAIAEQAGITEGTVIDLVYANGVITVSLPGHGAEPVDVSRWAGMFDGVWGRDQEEIDRNIRETRDEWEREPTG
jgi:AbrB family looped-hinge helix DNA binding protein